MNEYGRRGLAGVMHDHALATVVTVMLAWVVAVCAIVTSFGSLFSGGWAMSSGGRGRRSSQPGQPPVAGGARRRLSP